MIYLTNKILPILYSIVFLSTAYADPSISVNSYDEAVSLSKQMNLPILIIFSSDDCSYCNLLKENIPDIENTIVCFIDYQNNKQLVKQYKVSLIPDSIVIDHKENQLKRLKGFKDKHSYEAWLNK
jgi:thioredoxin-related protein